MLSEVVAKRLGNPNLDPVFPGYATETYLGVVTGEVPLSPTNFTDGFEDGDLDPWLVTP